LYSRIRAFRSIHSPCAILTFQIRTRL
jgi:hypothetical protein